MPQKNAANQITEGVIWKQLLTFFFPILLGTFFQQMYNTVDTIVVGRFVGTQALAALVFYIAYLRGNWLKKRIQACGMAPEIK